MKLNLNEKLVEKLYDSIAAQCDAETARKQAHAALEATMQAELVKKGIGKEALVEHIHMNAHHGNESDKAVISLVVNAWVRMDATDKEPRVMLRIRLGSVKGGLSNQYANLNLDYVNYIVVESSKGF